MGVDELIGRLAADGPVLADAAGRAGFDAAVPAIDWDVRSLVTHVGGVHRWAADIVRTAGDSFDTAAGEAVGTGPGEDELLDWFREGHAELVQALKAAPDDLACATFLPADSPRHFWARRQAHETAIHRADAEAAAGLPVAPFAAEFAQDGIAEIVHGFGARRRKPLDRVVTLALQATDGPSWDLRIGGERVEAEPGADAGWANAMVSGSSSDLYLWLWNRPSGATVSGDAIAAAAWARQVRVRWS